MKYFLAPEPGSTDVDPEWVIFRGMTEQGGDVVVTLPGTVPKADAEKVRKAIARARSDGSREAWDEIMSTAQQRRLRDEDG